MPNKNDFLAYDVAHDIVHSDYGGNSANCPLCNGSSSKDEAQKLAGDCISRRHQRNMYSPSMSYDDGSKKGSVQLLVDVMKFGEANKLPSEIQLVPIGEWNTIKYGLVTISKADIQQMAENFEKGIRKGVMIDVDHGEAQYSDAAAGWIKKVEVRDDGLWASELEWTDLGKQLLTSKIYKYMSPEFAPVYQDPEHADEVYNNVLIAGSLVNRPMFKELQAVVASEKNKDLTMDKNVIMLYFNSDPNNNSKNKPMPNIKDLAGKQKSELLKEELDFLKAHEAELSDEVKVKFGFKEPEKEITAREGNNVTISASELESLKASANKGAEAMKMLETKQISEDVEAISATEKGVRIKADDKPAVVTFMQKLTPDLRKEFTELMKKVPVAEVFGEVGDGEDAPENAATQNKLDVEAKKIMADEKVTYAKATELAMERNPNLNSYIDNVPSIN